MLILALPRGGVPVAYQIATVLNLPMDVLIVRKLGVPGEEELAMGAIASGGVRIVNRHVMQKLGLDDTTVDAVTATEQRELARRELLYRGNRPQPQLAGRTVVLVDDGVATGSTMRAAIALVRQQNPARVIVAAPVAAASTCDDLRAEGVDVVCLLEPEAMYAIGLWYQEFSQTSDEEVRRLLEHAWQMRAGRSAQ